MRKLIAATVSGLALAVAGAALAQEPVVTVVTGAELQSKADRYGEREIAELKDELATQVGRALAKAGAQRADLVIETATPNRPTFEQLRRRPGLSLQSFGLGGAAVSGTVTLADGTVEPLSYRWFETDISWSPGKTTWHDASRAFNTLAYRIARGDVPNQGAYKGADKDAGLFGSRYY